MPSCAEVLARTLKEVGITTMFGLPGGEILDFLEAARKEGIEFILTREEGTAAFMADVAGQIQRTPGVCVSTLGPGAVNMTLGVANAYLDRSPLIAITASLATSAEPYAPHQNLDLNAVYRPFTKMAITLDGFDTEKKVREAYAMSVAPRMGPVHIALPSDVAKRPDRPSNGDGLSALAAVPARPDSRRELEAVAAMIRAARRPVVILGIDINPHTDVESVRAVVERLGVPAFVTPKAKGILPADHPLFFGVCAGVAADSAIVDFFSRADLLIGIGFDPVESDKLWHQTMKLVSIGPVSIAFADFRPSLEAVGDLNVMLQTLSAETFGPFEWDEEDELQFRNLLNRFSFPSQEGTHALSPSEATRMIRTLTPRDAILVTDVGCIKSVSSQYWDTFSPLTFFLSNGLSAMGYGFSGAMAAKLLFPKRPIICIIGDGGFGMKLMEIETCIRHKIHFVTIVYNDNCLSMIRVSQESRSYPSFGVEYGQVDFASAAEALGAWTQRVSSLGDLEYAVRSGLQTDRPVVIDVSVDPQEYRVQGAATLASALAMTGWSGVGETETKK